MSCIVWGKMNLKDSKNPERDSEMIFELVELCAKNRFAIDFKSQIGIPNDIDTNNKYFYVFTISDNFQFFSCQNFLEPIYYPLSGEPTYDVLKKDLKKLEYLFKHTFSYGLVKNIEIYFSFGECDEDDYTKYNVKLDKFAEIVFNQYVESKWIPTIKVLIEK